MTDRLQSTDSREWTARRYDYGDSVVIAADLRLPEDAVTVDVVDGTAIVVVEQGEGSSQHEFDLPEGDAKVFMNNGVLTIQID